MLVDVEVGALLGVSGINRELSRSTLGRLVSHLFWLIFTWRSLPQGPQAYEKRHLRDPKRQAPSEGFGSGRNRTPSDGFCLMKCRVLP